MSGFSASPRGGYGPVFRGHVPSNTAITGGVTVNWTEDTDTHNAYGGGTGVFTVPAGWGGIYLVATLVKPSTSVSVGTNIRKNTINIVTGPATPAAGFSGNGVTTLAVLAAGDGLDVQFSGGFTTTNDLAGDNTFMHIAWLRP